MIYRADKSQYTYKRVCMDYATDERLSWEARGVMSYLLSKPDSWVIVLEDLIKRGDAGRDKVYRIMRELRSAGYVTATRQRLAGGKLGPVEYHLNERSPHTALPDMAEPDTANTYVDDNALQSGETPNHANNGNTLDRVPHTALPYTANPTLVNVDHELRTEEGMRADARIPTSQVSEESQAVDQPALFQDTMTNPNGMPGTPPPSSAAPPAPQKPKRERKPPAPPEVQRLYEPLYTLTNTAPRGEASIAARVTARNLWVDFSAMPDEVESFDSWFRKHSYPAQQAARERRSVTNPTIKQVYSLWPAFKAWRDAQQRRRVEPAAPVRDEPRRPLTPEELAELRATYERARSARTA